MVRLQSAKLCDVSSNLTQDSMDNKTKESIIKNALSNPVSKDLFKKQAYKVLGEVAQDLREAGIPDQVIAEMTALQIARLNRPSTMELAKLLIPIEPLPSGALPIFDKAPEEVEEVEE